MRIEHIAVSCTHALALVGSANAHAHIDARWSLKITVPHPPWRFLCKIQSAFSPPGSFLKGFTTPGYKPFRSTSQNYYGYDTGMLAVGESNQGIVVSDAEPSTADLTCLSISIQHISLAPCSPVPLVMVLPLHSHCSTQHTWARHDHPMPALQ